jgi:beta-fructofuranosidase
MERTNDSNHDVPCSYVSLPLGPHADEAPVESRGKWKSGLVIFCGLSVLVSLVAFNGYEGSNGNVTTLKSNEDLKQKTIPSYKYWKPVSRGVSAGVSEKSNRLFTKNNHNNGRMLFPWNNTMLSWQRTAFHFQPEENWMNGNYFFVCLYLN